MKLLAILLIITVTAACIGCVASAPLSAPITNDSYTLSVTGALNSDSGKPVTDEKVAVVDGKRYIMAVTGWGNNSSIYVYNATSDWEPAELLATSFGFTCEDFYQDYYPEVWPDRILLYGYRGSLLSFTGYYNTTTNEFFSMRTPLGANGSTMLAGYVTQMYYVKELNEFVITVVDGGKAEDRIVTSTPDDLFTQANWTYGNPIPGLYEGKEHMFAYDPQDGFGYIIRWDSHYGQEVIQVNMADGTSRSIYYTADNGSSNGLRDYVYADDTGLYFSSAVVSGEPGADNPGHWNYYRYSNDTLTLIGSRPIIQYGLTRQECHGPIYSIGDGLILCGSIRDSYPSTLYLYDMNSTLVETLTNDGYRWHCSDGTLTRDGDNIVIGGEGGLQVGIALLKKGH